MLGSINGNTTGVGVPGPPALLNASEPSSDRSSAKRPEGSAPPAVAWLFNVCPATLGGKRTVKVTSTLSPTPKVLGVASNRSMPAASPVYAALPVGNTTAVPGASTATTTAGATTMPPV